MRLASFLFLPGIMIILLSPLSWAGESIVIQGRVQDKANGIPIRLAKVILQKQQQTLHKFTDQKGWFYFSLQEGGQWEITIQRYGYKLYQLTVWVRKDTSLKFLLVPAPLPFPEVIVESGGLQRREEMQRSFQPISIVTAKEIKAISATDPADVLAYIPGMLIKNYGGMGGMKTVSLRGGASTQTPVLINGIRYDSFQTGITDLSTLSIDSFREIRVLRGGNAAQFGANALTGVIDLRTFDSGRKFKLKVGGVQGAYHYQAKNLAMAIPFPGSTSYFAFSQSQARGNHAYESNQFGRQQIRHRRNADFTQMHALVSFAKNHKRGAVAAVFLFNRSNRGVPGPVLQGREENLLARQNDEDLLLNLQNRWQILSNAVLHTWGKIRQSRLQYDDPELRIRPGGVHDHYLNRDALLGMDFRQILPVGLVYARFETGFARLSGNNLARPIATGYQRVDAVERKFVHGSLIWEREAKGTGIPSSAFQVALRYSRYSDIGQAFSPAFGVNWRPWSIPLHFRIHAAHNFRVPTFSEQYYLNFGNQKIRPERSISLDFGGNFQTDFYGFFQFDFSLFAIRTRDQIVAIPRSPVQWSAQNIGKTRNLGFELLTEWQSRSKLLQIRATYTRQDPRDRTPHSRTFDRLLVYIPQEIATAILATQWHFTKDMVFRGSINLRHASHRYHLPENDIDSLMKGYTVLDANFSLLWSMAHLNWRLRLDIENLTNTVYEIIRNYPVPLRLWRLGLQLQK